MPDRHHPRFRALIGIWIEAGGEPCVFSSTNWGIESSKLLVQRLDWQHLTTISIPSWHSFLFALPVLNKLVYGSKQGFD